MGSNFICFIEFIVYYWIMVKYEGFVNSLDGKLKWDFVYIY